MRSLKQKLKRVRPLLGTYVEIELEGFASETRLNTWITGGFKAVEEVDCLMSLYRPDSDLSRLNRTDSRVWLTLNLHTLKVLKAANDFYRISRGVFDIRCAGRRTSHAAPVDLRGDKARKTGPWTLDLGGIAKGYAVDYAVEKIKSLNGGGRISGVINAGGDLRQWGRGRMAFAAATSAVRIPQAGYERLSKADHVRMPEGKRLENAGAVTVLSEKCLWSDALTKIMLLGSAPMSQNCMNQYGAKGIRLA